LIAVSKGQFGAAITLEEFLVGRMTPDAASLLLSGQVNHSVTGGAYSTTRSALSGWSAATLAVGYAVRLPVDEFLPGALTIGATLKVNRIVTAVSALDFSTAASGTGGIGSVGWVALVNDKPSLSTGTGFGIDLGLAYQRSAAFRIGASFENILSDVISWDGTRLVYYERNYRVAPGQFLLVDSLLSVRDGAAYPLLPDARLRAARDSLIKMGNMPRRLNLGMNYLREKITLVAGISFSAVSSGGAPGGIGPSSRPGEIVRLNLPSEAVVRTGNMGVGLELRPVPAVALRSGLSTDGTGAVYVSGGAGFRFGMARLDVTGGISLSAVQPGTSLAAGFSVIR
jgi:hypothetical protein